MLGSSETGRRVKVALASYIVGRLKRLFRLSLVEEPVLPGSAGPRPLARSRPEQGHGGLGASGDF